MRILMLAVLVATVFGAVALERTRKALSLAGEIPTQVFVTYRSPDGSYALDVPKGWAQSIQGPNVRFTSALDGIDVTITRTAPSLTPADARDRRLAALRHSEPGAQIQDVRMIRLPAGPAVLVSFTSTALLDPVTGKRPLLENYAYFFSQNGGMAMLRLWAPRGADTSDQWLRVSRSFRWL